MAKAQETRGTDPPHRPIWFRTGFAQPTVGLRFHAMLS